MQCGGDLFECIVRTSIQRGRFFWSRGVNVENLGAFGIVLFMRTLLLIEVEVGRILRRQFPRTVTGNGSSSLDF